jgi:hypothetical protein
MATVNFPSNPTIGQQFTAVNKTWKWNGTSWSLDRSAFNFPTISGNAHKVLTVNANEDGFQWGNSAFEVPFFFVDAPTADQVIYLRIFTESVTFLNNFNGSQGKAGMAPSATYILSVFKNTTAVGNITIGTTGNATFSFTSGSSLTFVPGDVLKVIAPSTTDSVIAHFAGSLQGFRS